MVGLTTEKREGPQKAFISHNKKVGLQVIWEQGGDKAAICLTANVDTRPWLSSQKAKNNKNHDSQAGILLHHMSLWFLGHRWPMNSLI